MTWKTYILIIYIWSQIADADNRILHVNANFPGRVHDQFIFNQTNVKQEMQRLYESRIGQYYLPGKLWLP